MSYDANVYNVMIASPNDVAKERRIAHDVIYEWNAINSQSRKIVLLPIDWQSYASPEMGSHPQEIINKQVLEKSDILIGIFWTRLGTATNDYASGTVEEIEKHIGSGKLAMLYFSNQPVALDSVDIEQLDLLRKFKESCKARGLYAEYSNHSEFGKELYKHLQLRINNDVFFQKVDSEIDGNLEELDQSELSERTNRAISVPYLSIEAISLLKEASKDLNGTIIHANYLNGTSIQTNGKQFITSRDRRDIAKWEAALEELIANNLIVARGYRDEIYVMTNYGYQIADYFK